MKTKSENLYCNFLGREWSRGNPETLISLSSLNLVQNAAK